MTDIRERHEPTDARIADALERIANHLRGQRPTQWSRP